MRRVTRWLIRIVLGLAALTAALTLGAWWTLRASLPRTDGAVTVTGLTAPVTIDRDARGIPSIRGASLEDVALGLGFVHAQERFFQMDLSRRYTAGRLSELFGDGLASIDREMLAYDHVRACERHLAALPPRHRRLLERYAAGVNAGLDDLAARPPEYVVLRRSPAPWRPVDSMLVQASFFETLSFGEAMERPLLQLEAALPPEVVEFLTPDTSHLDALPLGEPAPPPPIPIPGPDVIDLRESAFEKVPQYRVHVFGRVPGSNNWAATGSRTAHGGAIVAGDPHLEISVPGVWFRTELEWTDGGRTRHARGVSAPGVPGIAIGATDAIAWSMTNFFGDHEDLVVVELDPAEPTRYRTPDGSAPFEVRRATVGGVEKEYRSTVFGPVVTDEGRVPVLALASTALRPGWTNLAILDIHSADTLEDALDAGARWRGPSQNLVVAAADGRIGWVVTGCFPKRRGFDGKAPRSWADGTRGWDGRLDESARPRVIVEDGVLFSANGRMLPVDRGRVLTRAWMSSERQRRVAELLSAPGPFTEADFRAMQLDTDLASFQPLRDLFLEVVPEGEPDPRLALMRELVIAWNGTADADQRALTILGQLQSELRERVLGPLLARASNRGTDIRFNWFLVDEPVHRLLEERPPHFLPRNVPSWTALLRGAVEAIYAFDAPWGELNRLRTAHPFADGAPAWLARRLSAPAHPQPGTTSTVRASDDAYGASLRLVASPSHPDQATLHMPIGQSGHPLSPHFMDAHESWRTGAAEPMLAGEAVSTLLLEPSR